MYSNHDMTTWQQPERVHHTNPLKTSRWSRYCCSGQKAIVQKLNTSSHNVKYLLRVMIRTLMTRICTLKCSRMQWLHHYYSAFIVMYNVRITTQAPRAKLVLLILRIRVFQQHVRLVGLLEMKVQRPYTYLPVISVKSYSTSINCVS
jgi:hypothetical protein